jgi:hypothetical protein
MSIYFIFFEIFRDKFCFCGYHLEIVDLISDNLQIPFLIVRDVISSCIGRGGEDGRTCILNTDVFVRDTL